MSNDNDLFVMPNKDFYNTVEVPGNLKHVVYGDTDSVYLEIPNENNVTDTLEKIKIVKVVAEDINNLVMSYTTKYLMPRCGFEPSHNETSFKTEMVLGTMIFSDKKKSYAFSCLSKEAELDDKGNLVAGKIFETPQITKMSTFGAKSDTIELSKDILDELINIAFSGKNPKEQYNDVKLAVKKYKDEFKLAYDNNDYSKIGTPVKWGKKPEIVNAMIFYNTIVENTFQQMSSGYKIYCTFSSERAIKNLDMGFEPSSIDSIVVPPNVNGKKLLDAMGKYGVSFDLTTQWDKIINTTVKRLIKDFEKRAKSWKK